MNANAILEKLNSDAKAAASAILKDADERADAMRKASEARTGENREKMLAQAKEDAVQQEQRMKRMYELEDRKNLLAAKREMISRAFGKALSMMEGMSPKDARAYLLETAADAAAGDEEIIVGDKNSAWFDDAFLKDLNAALVKAGKPGTITAGKEKRSGVCGLILAKNNTEVKCTFDAILESSRLELESEVANVLFPA